MPKFFLNMADFGHTSFYTKKSYLIMKTVGQGAIEYLLIIAAVVIIAVIVISLILDLGAQGQDATQSSSSTIGDLYDQFNEEEESLASFGEACSFNVDCGEGSCGNGVCSEWPPEPESTLGAGETPPVTQISFGNFEYDLEGTNYQMGGNYQHLLNLSGLTPESIYIIYLNEAAIELDYYYFENSHCNRSFKWTFFMTQPEVSYIIPGQVGDGHNVFAQDWANAIKCNPTTQIGTPIDFLEVLENASWSSE